MRILILGATGMLGHQLWLAMQSSHETWVTIRGSGGSLPDHPDFPRENLITGVDALNLESVIAALGDVRPDVVVNCIGIIKQSDLAHQSLPSLQVNALFPHQLALACRAARARLIHISTDCVFSGATGKYREDDISDATDLYGRTKFLGEATGPGVLTLRTSIVGRELHTRNGLLEWFLHQETPVRGYKRAIFSGFSTLELSRIIRDTIIPRPDLEGLYHVSAEPIAKFDLLELFRATYNHPIDIEPETSVEIDRSLDSSHFRQGVGYEPPTWKEMVEEMAKVDATKPYYS